MQNHKGLRVFKNDLSNTIKWSILTSWEVSCGWRKMVSVKDPLSGSQPCHAGETCLTQRSYKPCCVGPPKTDRSKWRVLTKCGPLEEGMANHLSILATRTPWMVYKVKERNNKYQLQSISRSLSLSFFFLNISITSLLKHIKENTVEKNIKVLRVFLPELRSYELFFILVYVFLNFQIIYNSCLCFPCFSIYFYWQNKKDKLKR